MQPTAPLWQLLCDELRERQMSAQRSDYVNVAKKFVADATHMLRPGSLRLADAREIAGDICAEAGANREAIDFYQEAYDLVAAEPKKHAAARLAAKLAERLSETEATEEARRFCNIALQHFEDCNDHSQHTHLLNLRASLERATGHPQAAVATYHEAIAIVQSLHGPSHSDLAILYNNLGVAWIEVGDYPSAEKALLQALGLRESIYGATHPEVAHSLMNLGVLHHARNDAPQACRFYMAALDIYRHFLTPDAEEIRTLEGYLAQLASR